jgi:hypothetical protein
MKIKSISLATLFMLAAALFQPLKQARQRLTKSPVVVSPRTIYRWMEAETLHFTE